MIGVVNKVLAIATVAAMLPSTAAFAQQNAAPAPDASAAPAAAQAKAKPKPKARPRVSVTVTNQRKAGLKELSAAAAGGPKSRKILSNLAAGGKAVVKMKEGA